jgi:hypothetical protein
LIRAPFPIGGQVPFVQDPGGNTMILEIPLPACVGVGSPFAGGVALARSEFNSHLTATTSFKTANIPVRVTGVGFFDFLHGQTGVAPNGIELHPVLDVVFNPSPNAALVASVLPASRSAQLGSTATAFATVLKTGSTQATGCMLSLEPAIPASFSFQTTDSSTNQLTGTANAPVDIPGGSGQSFVFAITPTAAFAPTEVQLGFDCTNTDPASIILGLNTLLLSASAGPVPDIVALGATVNRNGIVDIPGTDGTGFFSVATVDVGASGEITVAADAGSAVLPVNLFLCQTNPTTGQCLASPTSTVTTQINANATPTFAVFVQGHGTVPFDPANNRVFVRFKDAAGVTRGATSVAVRTQ